MDYTFCELRCKEVINMVDGRRLGHIIDMVLDIKCGTICGIIVPINRNFSFFRRCEDVYIPYKDIIRIGEDVILVEVCLQTGTKLGKKNYYSSDDKKEEFSK